MKTILQKSFALAALSFLFAQPVFAMTLAEAETACKKANGQLIVTRVATGARYVCKVGEKVVLSGMATPQAAPTPSQAAPTPVVPRAGLIGDKRPELLWDKKAPTPVTPAQPTTKSLAPKVTTVPAQVRVDSANAALAQEMKNAGRDAPAVAAALKARGASAQEIAQILKTVYDITDPAVIARILKTVGFAAEAVASALKSVYGLGAEAAARMLKAAGFTAPQVALALKMVFHLGAEADAQALKAAGFTAPQVALALKTVFNLDAQATFNFLRSLGYNLENMGKAMKDVYQFGAKAFATMLKIAGFDAEEIVGALKSAYGLGKEAIAPILGAIGYLRDEIANAFRPVGDAVKDAHDYITGTDPVWPGNIPTGTRAYYDTPASIRVTWNDNATGEDRYYVNVKRDNRGWVSYVLPHNRTSFVVTGVGSNSTYCIDIKAFKHGKGWTNPSRPIVCIMNRQNYWAGQPPVITSMQRLSDDRLKIVWRDNTRDETGFKLYIVSAGGTEGVKLPANQTEYILSGAVATKQRYCAFVTAFKGRINNATAPSNTVCSALVVDRRN